MVDLLRIDFESVFLFASYICLPFVFLFDFCLVIFLYCEWMRPNLVVLFLMLQLCLV